MSQYRLSCKLDALGVNWQGHTAKSCAWLKCRLVKLSVAYTLLTLPNIYVIGIKSPVLITEAQRFMGDMILSVLYHMIS